ncbi:MAG: hypothetical protein K2Q01_03410 [Rickettsiales bacterium]|nr:hypothetical protein [Rickettsiales bacterium]
MTDKNAPDSDSIAPEHSPTLTRRAMLLATFSAMMLTMVIPGLYVKKWMAADSPPDTWVHLLGPGFTSAKLADIYLHADDGRYADTLHQRVNRILSQVSHLPLNTHADAVHILENLMQKNYAEGALIIVNGWVLPESLVVMNAYARQNNL